MEYWEKKDPVVNFEKYLVDKKIYSNTEIVKERDRLKDEINKAVKISFDNSKV